MEAVFRHPDNPDIIAEANTYFQELVAGIPVLQTVNLLAPDARCVAGAVVLFIFVAVWVAVRQAVQPVIRGIEQCARRAQEIGRGTLAGRLPTHSVAEIGLLTDGRGEITALIVDDEELARQRLRELLEVFPSIRIAGEAGRLADAKRLVLRLEPDVVFLDIQLFGKNGFDLLDDLPEHTCVIFVTAYDEYAIRAFEVNALDYLMKPVDPERLARAVQRLHPSSTTQAGGAGRMTETDRILLQSGRTRWFELVSAICSIQADGDYTSLNTIHGRKVLFRRTMKEWMNMLPEKFFMRAHRNRIINVCCIERMERIGVDRMAVWLRGCNAQPLEVSRRRLPDLMRRVKNMDGHG